MDLFNKKNYDFIGIGDIVTDAFIKLKEATVEKADDSGYKKICMRFGDKIPYEEVIIIPAVGNSANASVSAARLGLKTAFVSNIGDDYYGLECLNVLRQEKVGIEFVKINKEKKTNYHYVLMFGAERTILIKHEEFDYEMPDIGEPRWIYISSLGENSLDFHSQIEKYLKDRPNIKLAFQPGTFQMKLGREKLKSIYERSDAFFCNREEAQKILEVSENDPKKLMQMLQGLGPKIVAVTDGPSGAYASDGNKAWFLPMYPDPKPPINRTGAGDAFSSTFTVALALGKGPEEALMWGPINSMSVVQKMGARAGLLKQEELLQYLKNAPADYKPRLI
ncbi:MAG: carbohydrate kinase family protein [Patescibacteria group bacterium]